MRLTYANILTLSRIFIAPIFLAFILVGTSSSVTIGAILFGIAALTDWADGYLARKYEEVTEHGEYLDPLADKILTISAFVSFYLLDIMPLWMIILIVVRDFIVTVLRNVAEERGETMTTSFLAKLKTALQMIVIVVVLFLYWLSIFDEGLVATSRLLAMQDKAVMLLYSGVVWWSLFLLTLYTAVTGIDYVFRYRHLFRKANG
ncbi:MAG: CDP-diacylglycerol--glycerol-3-phosphate 3-phosphatidyltransferase [Bradyrhizobiaceae bacterium]|nr:CDP-diacylglycerol--glycerol-3-phosphate 3-phosphatidyltransferase [Bradyrhizobiaceae bacterium]